MLDENRRSNVFWVDRKKGRDWVIPKQQILSWTAPWQWQSLPVVLNLFSATPPWSKYPLFQAPPDFLTLTQFQEQMYLYQTFHAVDRIRARAPLKFNDAFPGSRAPRLRTTGLYRPAPPWRHIRDICNPKQVRKTKQTTVVAFLGNVAVHAHCQNLN